LICCEKVNVSYVNRENVSDHKYKLTFEWLSMPECRFTFTATSKVYKDTSIHFWSHIKNESNVDVQPTFEWEQCKKSGIINFIYSFKISKNHCTRSVYASIIRDWAIFWTFCINFSHNRGISFYLIYVLPYPVFLKFTYPILITFGVLPLLHNF
jgi:hypothetical protein